MYNHQLDTFLKVAELGSFGKAAEFLYISPTAAIQQINLLENSCGFKLFTRSNHGVKLTPAGRSLFEDAQALIRLSEESLKRARKLAESSEYTLRIGTSLLYKCRLLPDLWTQVTERFPRLKIEIRPIKEYDSRSNVFSLLGVDFDLFEGIYASSWDGSCNFLELSRTPICCAVSPRHRLAQSTKLSMLDLNGEYLVMPVRGVSRELDHFRDIILAHYPTVQIIDSNYYGIDTFAMCEMNSYVLITQPVYHDIHPNLKCIPLECDITLPYGLIYAKEPTAATLKFIDAVK